MKQNFITAGILLVTSILSMSSFSIRENPQNHPREEKAQKHIVLKKMDDKGIKVSLDTIIGEDDIFVWHGDTIGGKSIFNLNDKDGINADSLLKSMYLNFEYEINENGDAKVIVIKSKKGDKNIVHEFITDGDSNKTITVHLNTDDFLGDQNVMFWNDEEGTETFFAPHISNITQLPDVPKMIFSEKNNHDNIIDLSDSGIISYKKKMNKDGTEKITIVRKQVNENKIEKFEEIIMAPGLGNSDAFFGKSLQVKRIKIIKEAEKESEIEFDEKK